MDRREFLGAAGMVGGSLVAVTASAMPPAAGSSDSSRSVKSEFAIYQERRRWELWNLPGDLPWDHKATPPQLVRKEKHDGYTLERWILDLNGVEPVPALLLVPDRRQDPAPGLLFIHWHAGQYDLG